MKSRRVFVTLEVETDAPLPLLRRRGSLLLMVQGPKETIARYVRILQAQANVATTLGRSLFRERARRRRARRKA